MHQAELHQTKKGTGHHLAHGEAVEVSFRGDVEDKPQSGKRNEDGGVALAPAGKPLSTAEASPCSFSMVSVSGAATYSAPPSMASSASPQRSHTSG